MCDNSLAVELLMIVAVAITSKIILFMCRAFPQLYLDIFGDMIKCPYNLTDNRIHCAESLNIFMKTLIAFLLLWIGSETNYNVNIPHPTVKMVSETTLEQMYYGDAKVEDHVHALYDPKTDIIYVKDTFNMYNVFDKGILLHELIHYVQDVNGAIDDKFRCWNEAEAEVYPLQQKYLLEVHGVKWEYDPMYLKIISSCDKNR